MELTLSRQDKGGCEWFTEDVPPSAHSIKFLS
jgi:hypothetical protein